MLYFPEDVKKILNEQYNQQLNHAIHMVELPCTKYHKHKEPALIEIKEARDQKVLCPRCGREHYFIFSTQGNHTYA